MCDTYCLSVWQLLGSMFSSQTIKQKYLLRSICLRYIDGWPYHNKIFSFKTKKSIVARHEYMNDLKIPSAISSQNHFGWPLKSWNICFWNVSKVQRALLNIQPNSSNKMSFHKKCTSHLGKFSFWEIYINNNKAKSKNTMFTHAINYTHKLTCMCACTCMCDSTCLREQCSFMFS